MAETDSKYFERYKLFEKSRDFISEELKKVFRKCENTSSIKESNLIFHRALSQAKEQAFKAIETNVNKPWVVYMVNAYWKF